MPKPEIDFLKLKNTLLVLKQKIPMPETFWGGRPLDALRCGLCRFVAPSPKAMSAIPNLCLSCHMRDRKPKVVFFGGQVARWRRPLSQTTFAALCGVSQPALSVIEAKDRAYLSVATKVATALALSVRHGNTLRLASQEWPMFPCIVDRSAVDSELDRIEREYAENGFG